LGDTRGCPTRALLQLEEKLSFPMAVFWTSLKWVRSWKSKRV
jgi:hypothetical protein